MTDLPRQFVLVLDLQQRVPEAEFVRLLPAARREIRVFRLSGFAGAETLEAARDRREFDLELVAEATDSLLRSARAESESVSAPVHWFVLGRAPLPVFAHVGHALSAWTRPMTVLNRRKDGEWDVVHLESSPTEGSEPFFDVVRGLDEPSEASGRLAVFVSVRGDAAPREALRNYLEERGDGLAGIVEIRTRESVALDGESGSRVAAELEKHMASIPGAYPHAIGRGIAVFIAGPAHLAFLAGRAVNPTIVSETWFPNFDGGRYVDGVSLPLRERSAARMDHSPEAVEARRRTREVVRDAFETLGDGLQVDHLPELPLSTERRQRFIDALRELRWSPASPEDGFALRILHRELSVGEELVDALRTLADDDIRGVLRQLVVHEFFHDFQELTRANYRQIGRAGLVLEELDFWADSFSVQALARFAAVAGVSRASAVRSEINRVLAGIEAFDKSEYGPKLGRLYERRLRRYLIWHLQRARASTLRNESDVDAMFASRLAVELVPTAGYLDDRGDKVVRSATDRTQLVVICDGRLARFPADDNLRPAAMVEDVRLFRREALAEAMDRVVGYRAELLAPWAVP